MKTATINFEHSDLERFDSALSDLLCWVSGFKAAGGNYSPGTEGSLVDLRFAIHRAIESMEAAA